MATTCGTNVRMSVLLTLAVIRPCSSRNMHAIYHTYSTEQQSRVVVLVGKNVSRCSLTGASCVHLACERFPEVTSHKADREADQGSFTKDTWCLSLNLSEKGKLILARMNKLWSYSCDVTVGRTVLTEKSRLRIFDRRLKWLAGPKNGLLSCSFCFALMFHSMCNQSSPYYRYVVGASQLNPECENLAWETKPLYEQGH